MPLVREVACKVVLLVDGQHWSNSEGAPIKPMEFAVMDCITQLTGRFMSTEFTIESLCVTPMEFPHEMESKRRTYFLVTVVGSKKVPDPSSGAN